MKLKQGRKLTEVGVIPEDWDVISLGGLEPFVTSGSRGWAHYYSDFGSPFLRITNLSRATINVSLEKLKFVKVPESEAEAIRTSVEEGDLLVSITADIGIIGYVGDEIPLPAYINQHIALVRIDPLRACSQFLAYFLASRESQRRFRALTDQGAKAGMSLETVKSLQVGFPPELEQRHIAAAIADIDSLLTGVVRLIAKKRDLKQAAMQQLLTGETRLPGFIDPWKIMTFAELFSFSGGYSASRDQLSDEGYCYLHYGDIHGAKTSTVDTDRDFDDIPKLEIPLSKIASKSLLEDGDIVFVDASEDNDGTSRHIVVRNKSNKPFIAGLHTIVAKSKTDDLDREYKIHCFKTAELKGQFLFYAVGTKVSGISKSNIGKLSIPVPSLPEQSAIASVLSDMDAELASLEQKLEKTRSLKQAMMQELLTGRIRLV